MIETDKIIAKPFLRWAGGKSWLIKHLSDIINLETINNYHEPFLGGAAIFFHLQPENSTFLSDLNPKLIETYNVVKDNVELVIGELRKFTNTKEKYYEIRAKKYKTEHGRAAQFIYLNQTSYNGIYRENLKGEYNVPFGFRTKDFLESENLRHASQCLQNTNIISQDFVGVLNNVNQGDLIFLDPPYTVSHNRNGFIKYNKHLFSLDDQYRLKEVIEEVNRKGAYYIMTNAAHSKINEIFNINNDKRLELTRSSLIGGMNAQRVKISEYIFTNIK